MVSIIIIVSGSIGFSVFWHCQHEDYPIRAGIFVLFFTSLMLMFFSCIADTLADQHYQTLTSNQLSSVAIDGEKTFLMINPKLDQCTCYTRSKHGIPNEVTISSDAMTFKVDPHAQPTLVKREKLFNSPVARAFLIDLKNYDYLVTLPSQDLITYKIGE